MSYLSLIISSSIHFLNNAKFTYTPGVLLSPQPIPHDTIPTWWYLLGCPGISQTNGLPPSPKHTSFLCLLPAHKKLLCNWKYGPNLVFLNEFIHVSRETIEKTFNFRNKFGFFIKRFLFHAVTIHVALSTIIPAGGMQIVLILSVISIGFVSINIAISFCKEFKLYSGWIIDCFIVVKTLPELKKVGNQ